MIIYELEIVIDFFKQQGLYNKEYFDKIRNNTKVYDKPYEEIKEFVGCYPLYDGKGNIIDFKLVLPSIKNIYDVLIYIHEYSHALFISDDSEIFPNIMESLFINKYINNDIKLEIIEKTKKEILIQTDEKHRLGKKVKLMAIKK